MQVHLSRAHGIAPPRQSAPKEWKQCGECSYKARTDPAMAKHMRQKHDLDAVVAEEKRLADRRDFGEPPGNQQAAHKPRIYIYIYAR